MNTFSMFGEMRVVGLSVPTDMLHVIDQAADAALVSRASFIRSAILEKLTRDGHLADDDARDRKAKKAR